MTIFWQIRTIFFIIYFLNSDHYYTCGIAPNTPSIGNAYFSWIYFDTKKTCYQNHTLASRISSWIKIIIVTSFTSRFVIVVALWSWLNARFHCTDLARLLHQVKINYFTKDPFHLLHFVGARGYWRQWAMVMKGGGGRARPQSRGRVDTLSVHGVSLSIY